MFAEVMRYSPNTWCRNQKDTLKLYSLSNFGTNCEEYKQIAYEANVAMDTEHSNLKVVRVQNIHNLGQFLIKQQKLLVESAGQTFYQVRRYVVISQNYLSEALEYNLDHRRCRLSQLEFKKSVPQINQNNVLVVVQVILKTQNQDYIGPEYSDEYYIEYFITL